MIISTISISETSQPKIIIYAITLIILLELKKFSDDSQNICTLVCLLLVGWNLKYLYIISYIYIAFFIFLLIKILRNKIKLKENLKNIIYLLFFFLIPDFINKFDIFGTISPSIFKSKYDITENFFLKEIEFVRDFDIKTYFIFWSLVFLKKHFLVIFALFFILFFRKQKLYFNVILFLSYCISIIIISFLWFPDQFNPKRYLWPLESALIVFFVLQIIYDKFLTNFKEKYKYLFKISFALGCIYLALLTPKPWNFYELFKNKFQNIYNVFSSSDNLNKNFFFKNKIPNENIIKEYQREFYSCFNTLDKDKNVLSILNYPFLINEKKLRQLEINTGFLFTKHLYPIFQSFHEKNKFLKKNYEGIIIEKNLIYNNSILDKDLSEFNYRLNKEKINLTGFYPNYTKYDMLNLISWLDFVSFLQKLKFLSKVNCETDNFISFKF
jgi:hypothetical protein